MMQKMLLFSFCLLLSLPAIGQKGGFQSGYWINLKGDTLKGFVRYKSWAEKVVVKKNEDDPEGRDVFPDQISGFQIDSVGFFRSVILKGDSIFTRRMVDGPSKLYQYKRAGNELLFIENEQQFMLVDPTNLKDFLIIYTGECAKEVMPSKKIRYNLKSVGPIIENYNECKEPGSSKKDGASIFELNDDIPWIALGFRGGANIGELIFPPGTYYSFGEYENFALPSGAFLIRARLNDRMRLSFEPGITLKENEGTQINVYPFNEPAAVSDVSLRMAWLDLPMIIQYGFPIGNFRFSAELGMRVGGLLDYNFTEIPSPEAANLGTPNVEPSTLEYGGIGGLNISYRKKHIELFIGGRYYYDEGEWVIRGIPGTVSVVSRDSDLITRRVEASVGILYWLSRR
ncbi:MAG: hypothetical protein AAGI38_19690 [Bacteroidota bacterium]